MASYLPHKKGFAGYATRFVDPALGKFSRDEVISFKLKKTSQGFALGMHFKV